MNVPAQRAVYGDVNGAHALIEPKVNAPHPLGKLTRFTDRPGHLPPNVEWQPFFSGYPFEDYYILSITFPDSTASRAGMVLTHALIFKLSDAIQMPSLMSALKELPTTPRKNVGESQIEVVIREGAPSDTVPPELPSVVRHLLDETRGEHPVVWVGQEGFADIVSAVWRGLWPEARRQYRFRLSFTPQDVEGQNLTLITIPQGVENRWETYPLVRPSDVSDPQTKAEALLLGQPEGEPLRGLMRDLATEPRTVSDLNKLEACYNYLERLHASRTDISTNGVRMLVRLLGTLSPDANSGIVLKTEALNKLLDLTAHGTAADVQALRNFDPQPFKAGDEKIKKSVAKWVQEHILATEESASRQNIDLIKASLASTDSLWDKSVQSALRLTLSAWSSGSASAIWRWWQEEPALIKGIEPLIPNSQRAEADLAKTCPHKLPEQTGEAVRSLAQKRSWFVLHAAAISAYYGPIDALNKQLKVDRDESHFEGLRTLATKVPPASLLKVALGTGDSRLLRLTGEMLVRESSLMAQLDINRTEWRRIWLYAAEAGASIIAGVENPRETVDALITLLINGTQVEAQLLRHLADTPYADLTQHPHRAEVWLHMEEQLRRLFLNATADGWLRHFKDDSNFDLTLEGMLQTEILSQPRIAQYVSSLEASGVSFLVNLFRRFTRLSSNQLRELIDIALRSRQPINGFDAVLLGRFIREKGWRDCAKQLASYLASQNRRDLVPAVRECQGLLGRVESFMLNFTGKIDGGRITKDDWWGALTEMAADLYQDGPGQWQLWERAGGDLSSINRHQSGRAGWGEAMHALRRGGGGDKITPYTLLNEMRHDYANNAKLLLLQQWLQHRK